MSELSVSSLYKRILLKISGEALQGNLSFGISPEFISGLVKEIKEILDLGVEINLVIGGGNFFRGVRSQELHMGRANADYMGMLATVLNGIAIRDALEKIGVETRLISALEINKVAEPFVRKKAISYLQKNMVNVFVAGTGNPYFTTDTGAALRAIETECDVLIKATKVDGVFSDDPMKNPEAKKYDIITYDEVLNKGLQVMDQAAIILCRDNKIPLKVFDLTKKGNIIKVVTDKKIGTLVVEG